MALSAIPLTNDLTFQTFNVVLENQTYEITLQYNPRDESWYIYFGLPSLTPIFKTKVTNGTDILKKYRAYEDVPNGALFVVDNHKDYGRLGRDSFFSGRFSLLYADESTRLLVQEI
jgi:hypothetical protein